MEQGPSEQQIIVQSVKAGLDLPEKIKNAPSLLPGLELYYIGFMDLFRSRVSGMGPGSIWWDTIQNYCEKKKLDDQQTEAMHFHITEMDDVYVEHCKKE